VITVNGHKIKADIFPDGTSQVWHLPPEIIKAKSWIIDWYFEQERELIDLLSLGKLINNGLSLSHDNTVLNIPFLPGGRQDKLPFNNQSFTLVTYGTIINDLGCRLVSSIDTHCASAAKRCIKNFLNIEVSDFHSTVIREFKPDYLVFPDAGARCRYPYLTELPYMQFVFEKVRNQSTGVLSSHQLENEVKLPPNGRYLIIDDLCDGGATFISIAQQVYAKCPDAKIGLAVTHGIFSRGREYLTEAGLEVFTTNTLLKNKDDFKVC
jgi:ribose-phosphate pyrophosphokinase